MMELQGQEEEEGTTITGRRRSINAAEAGVGEALALRNAALGVFDHEDAIALHYCKRGRSKLPTLPPGRAPMGQGFQFEASFQPFEEGWGARDALGTLREAFAEPCGADGRHQRSGRMGAERETYLQPRLQLEHSLLHLGQLTRGVVVAEVCGLRESDGQPPASSSRTATPHHARISVPHDIDERLDRCRELIIGLGERVEEGEGADGGVGQLCSAARGKACELTWDWKRSSTP